MKATLIALLLVSCGAREAADAIRDEAQATPEPTPTPEAPPSEVQLPPSEVQLPVPTPTATPTPAPATVVVYVPATPAPMPTTEQVAAERQQRFELCRRDNLEPCREQGYTSSLVYRCAEYLCEEWKQASLTKLGPWKDWYTSKPPY